MQSSTPPSKPRVVRQKRGWLWTWIFDGVQREELQRPNSKIKIKINVAANTRNICLERNLSRRTTANKTARQFCARDNATVSKRLKLSSLQPQKNAYYCFMLQDHPHLVSRMDHQQATHQQIKLPCFPVGASSRIQCKHISGSISREASNIDTPQLYRLFPCGFYAAPFVSPAIPWSLCTWGLVLSAFGD